MKYYDPTGHRSKAKVKEKEIGNVEYVVDGDRSGVYGNLTDVAETITGTSVGWTNDGDGNGVASFKFDKKGQQYIMYARFKPGQKSGNAHSYELYKIVGGQEVRMDTDSSKVTTPSDKDVLKQFNTSKLTVKDVGNGNVKVQGKISSIVYMAKDSGQREIMEFYEEEDAWVEPPPLPPAQLTPSELFLSQVQGLYNYELSEEQLEALLTFALNTTGDMTSEQFEELGIPTDPLTRPYVSLWAKGMRDDVNIFGLDYLRQSENVKLAVGLSLANAAVTVMNNGGVGNGSGGVGKTPVIGRMDDMKNVGANEYRVADLLPDQGSPKANWNQNSGVLRSVMNEGNPIRDASPFNSSFDPKLGISGTQNANTFLHMERNLLYDHGWRYSNGFWSLP